MMYCQCVVQVYSTEDKLQTAADACRFSTVLPRLQEASRLINKKGWTLTAAIPNPPIYQVFRNLLDYIRQGRYAFSMIKTVQLFKALADETRLRIISLLLTDGELCVCDIITALKLPQSTISRHLAYLKRTGWVADRKCGLWVHYSIKTQDTMLLLDLKAVVQRHITTLPALAADRKHLEDSGRDHNCV